MYYIKLDEDGYLQSIYGAPVPGTLELESLEGVDLNGGFRGVYRWDGEKFVLDPDRLRELQEEARRADDLEKIEALKAKLTATDYTVIKIAEGAAAKEEYADIIAQRQAWREEINRLEGTVL